MSNRDDSNDYNPAAELEIPVMQPRGADLRGAPTRTGYAPPRTAVRGEIDDEPGRLERTRVTGQRPITGLGEPQPFQPAVILNQAHGLLEQYQRDKSKIDPVFVQIMTLQALGTFGSQAAKVAQLTNEVARLRKAVESMGADERRGDKPQTRRERLLARKGAANGRARAGGGLRGRFARDR